MVAVCDRGCVRDSDETTLCSDSTDLEVDGIEGHQIIIAPDLFYEVGESETGDSRLGGVQRSFR